MPDIKTVRDRKLPTKLDPECKRSQAEGARGKGMNEMTMNESMMDVLGMAPHIDGDADCPGCSGEEHEPY